jgi:hypothetical protein
MTLGNINAAAGTRFTPIKVIVALKVLRVARPWTCRSPRAILTIR